MKKSLILLTLIMLTAAGCGGDGLPAGDVTLNFWGTFENSQNMQDFINEYQKLRPNVRITYSQKNIENYENDLINALAAGTGPDIFSIHNDWLPKYKDKIVEAPSNILTLKDYRDAFVDVAVNDFVSDNKVYALPITVDSLALYYNKDILGSYNIATPPKTWAQLRSDVKKMSLIDNSGFFRQSGIALGTTNNVNRAEDILYLLVLQNRTVPYTSDFSQATLDQAIRDENGNTFFPAASAIKFYTDFSDPASDVYSWNQRSNYSIDAFANGEAAFMYGYSFTRDAIKKKSPNLNFDVAQVPQPRTDQTLVNFANYWGQAVSKQSKNQDYAWDFIKFMGKKENLEKYYQRHPLPSSRKDIINDQLDDPFLSVFASANLTAKSFYKKDQAKVDQIIKDMIDSIVLRGRKINESLNNANQQINFLNSR